jgi:PAS domain S-box-containing protein
LIFPQLFDPSNYHFSLYSIPTLVVMSAILALGILVVVRERASFVSLAFFSVTFFVSVWLFGFSWIYSSANEQTALTWSRFAYLGVPFIPPAVYLFTVSVLRIWKQNVLLVTASWIIGAVFSTLSLFSDLLLTGTHSYWWGYYPTYNLLGIPFLTFFGAMLLVSMGRFWSAYRKATPGMHKLRVKWLMVAFAIGYVGSIDFLAVYGVPVYPAGFLCIFGFLLVAARAVWTYRLVDITPAFAANQIIRTMSDALVVLDTEGVIRLANHAATALFGCQEKDLMDKPVTLAIGGPLFSCPAAKLVELGATNNYEMPYHRPEGDMLTLSISISVMRNKRDEPVAIVCIVRDITERKQFQERIQHQLQRLAALRNVDMAISASHDLRVTLNVILDQVTSQLRVDAAAVLLLDPHTQILEHAAGCGFRFDSITHSHVRVGESYAGRAAAQRRTLHIPDITATSDLHSSLQLVGEDFIAYYAVPLLVKGHVKGVLEIFHRAPLDPQPEWVDFVEALAGQAAIAIESASMFNDLQITNAELALAYDTTLEGWSRALDLRDNETEGHTRRVTEMSVRLARAFGMSEAELVQVRRGALLHDIGKMGIPDSILLKPGPLTEQEWEIMRMHPVYAYELLSPISFLRPALDIPYCHHEKWDGTGYPRGLKGEEIPKAARVFAVIDVWDALRSNRPYRAAWPESKVREHIRSLSGTHFDPVVVEAFLKTVEHSHAQRPAPTMRTTLDLTLPVRSRNPLTTTRTLQN